MAFGAGNGRASHRGRPVSNDLNLTKEKLLRFLDRLGASAKDLLDVTEMLRRKLVTPEELLVHADAIRPEIKRYPAVDEESFIRRVKEFLGGFKDV